MKLLNFQINNKKKLEIQYERELKDAERRKAEAAEKGDISENNDFKVAVQDEKNLIEKLSIVREELRNAEEIPIDNGSTFEVGSLLKLEIEDSNGNKLKPIGSDDSFFYLFLLPSGDTIFDGVLSTNSWLGKRLLGENINSSVTSGVLKDTNYKYKVYKLSSQDTELFTKQHPEEKEVIKRIFESVE